MELTLTIGNTRYQADLRTQHDLSIPLSAGQGRLSAWYVDPIQIEAVRTEQFTGAVSEGGSVNFRNIAFNPHGHGTHTECMGHITPTVHSVNETFREFLLPATLVSVTPQASPLAIEPKNDLVIRPEDLPDSCPSPALIIRTLPNPNDKRVRAYSDSNPPYLLPETMQKIVDLGVEHLLIDLPSVDREKDGGALACHHLFWGIPSHPRGSATITELIYVPDEVRDGHYLLNLQVAPFENDASPSRPVLYPLFALPGGCGEGTP